jgi:hypothetical protein
LDQTGCVTHDGSSQFVVARKLVGQAYLEAEATQERDPTRQGRLGSMTQARLLPPEHQQPARLQQQLRRERPRQMRRAMKQSSAPGPRGLLPIAQTERSRTLLAELSQVLRAEKTRPARRGSSLW